MLRHHGMALLRRDLEVWLCWRKCVTETWALRFQKPKPGPVVFSLPAASRPGCRTVRYYSDTVSAWMLPWTDPDVELSGNTPAPCQPECCCVLHHHDNELNSQHCRQAPVECFLYKCCHSMVFLHCKRTLPRTKTLEQDRVRDYWWRGWAGTHRRHDGSLTTLLVAKEAEGGCNLYWLLHKGLKGFFF